MDTVVMMPARDGLATAALWADILLTGAFVLVLVGLGVLLLQLRGIQRTVKELTGRLEQRAGPILDRGRDVAANVEFITAAVRTDIQRVSDTVRSLSDRLQTASDRMEERIEEFNALMEVVQTEAEDVVISTAATMHGVRAGARAFGRRKDLPAPTDDDALLEEDTGPTADEVAESSAGAARRSGA